MATCNIITDTAPYYTILVEFDGLQFEQTIVSNLKGAALTAFLQSYCDSYASHYVAQVNPRENQGAAP